MDLVFIGKIVNTHGIKGELRILSEFEYKIRILKKGSKIYIDNNEYIILANSNETIKYIIDQLVLKE